MEPKTIDQLKKNLQLPAKIDWISGNPADPPPPAKKRRTNHLDQDYRKTIYYIKADLTIVSGSISKDTDGKYTYTGTFQNLQGQLVPAGKLSGDDKKAIEKDFEQERSNLMNNNPNYLASLLLPPNNSLLNVGNSNDADNDGIQNGWDDCPNTYNPLQLDSEGNGIGDACRTALICDADRDGTIDIYDISAIIAARGLPVAQFEVDPRDADGDGVITANDARICAQLCTYPDCSPPPR